VKFVRDCPRVEGVSEILLPGDSERKTAAQRMAQGVPIDDGNWKQLAQVAQKLNVPLP